MKLNQEKIKKLEEKLQQAGLQVKYRRPALGELRLQKCPLHRDKTPSLTINVFENRFRCMSCGFKGTLTKLLKEYGVDYHYSGYYVPTIDELEELLNEVEFGGKNVVNNTTEYDDIVEYKANQIDLEAYRYYHPYLESRGFKREFILANKIGFDKKSLRVTIPIFMDGIYWGCARRSVVGDIPKIIYDEGMPKDQLLYLPLTNSGKSDKFVPVEGPIDALKGNYFGQDTGAILGCDVSDKQLDLIYEQANGRDIIWALDHDLPGKNGIQKALSKIDRFDNFFVFKYDDSWCDEKGKCDIGMLSQEQFNYGIDNAISIIEYY